MISIEKKLREKLKDILKDLDLSDKDIKFEIPPERKFGDLSTPLAFTLAKKLRKAPFVIAQDLAGKIIEDKKMISDIKVEKGGFLNIYFQKDFLLTHLLDKDFKGIKSNGLKAIVEHTSINPNKSAHIGHLRNACLGDMLAKALRFLGWEVEVENYLDDTGIQLADVVWGVLYYKNMSLDEVKNISNLSDYLWTLYSEVNNIFKSDNSKELERSAVHKKIEDKTEPEYSMSSYIAHEVLKEHMAIMESLNIRYDLLVRESDIIAMDFFKEAQEVLTSQGIMYDSEDPEKKDCKVILYEKENIEKIITRSNGTVTYIGKDIAYSMWKTAYFKRDFLYKEFSSYNDGKKVYITLDKDGEKNPNNFGSAQRAYNVIDCRQAYLQNIISQVLQSLNKEKEERKDFIHYSYEMVALTPACVKELNLPLDKEEENKAYVEVSGRKGRAIKASDLIEILKKKSFDEIKKRHPQLNEDKMQEIALDIAVGALRYFMIKFVSNSVIAFDFKEALSFEGDTGPYLQYSMVRINSIFNKLKEQGIVIERAGDYDINILSEEEYDSFHEILLTLFECELIVQKGVETAELSSIASYTYLICQKFNNYYHNYPILKESNKEKQALRILIISLVKDVLLSLFNICGIPVPEKM